MQHEIVRVDDEIRNLKLHGCKTMQPFCLFGDCDVQMVDH